MRDLYQIHELAKLFGLHPDTLRYYEEKGLLHPERRENGYRVYHIQDICALNIIRAQRELGVPVEEIGAYLEERLDELAASEDTVLERRGTGLIQGIRLTKPAGEVTARAMEEGLVIITARSDVIRFVPPMVITKEHVDEMIEKLKKSL